MQCLSVRKIHPPLPAGGKLKIKVVRVAEAPFVSVICGLGLRFPVCFPLARAGFDLGSVRGCSAGVLMD